MSHANRVRQLIGGMKMCSLCSYGALLGILVFSSTIAVGQNDPLIESLRPKVLFSEDFEKYTIGTQTIEGSPSEVGVEIGQESSGSVETQAGDLSLPSKQLVVSEGVFAWETDPIILSEPILTSVSIDFTAVAGPLGFSSNDRVRIYAVLGSKQIAPDPLLELNLVDDVLPNTTVEMTGTLPIGALAEARWDNSLPNGSGFGGITGVVTRPRQLRLVIDLASENPGNYLALDDLIATEESATIKDPADWELQARRVIPFNVSSNAVLDPGTPIMEIGAAYDLSEVSFDLTELNDGDLCLGSRNPLEDQRFHEVQLSRTGVDRFGRESIFFTMERPDKGWQSLTSWPGLFVCREGQTPVSIDRGSLVGSWANPPWSTEWSQTSITLEPLSAEPIEGYEAHVDFTVLIEAAFPYPQANLDQIEVFARMGWLSGETVQATYQGVVESLDEGRSLRLGYRLNKPPYGWPTQKIQIDIVGELPKVGGDGFSNFLRVAPGRSTVEVVIPPSDIIPPGETGPASRHPQFVLPSQESFTINVDYVSKTAMDLRSIGDGDVVFLGEPKQLGRLISIKPSDGNRKVRATFEFQRDAVGYRNERFLAFDYPNGAVSNIDGETSIGLTLRDTRFTNIPLWKDPNEAQLSTGFIPLGPLDSSLESYRFRIVYQSAASPLNPSDFDRNHLIVTPEKLEAPSFLKPSSIETTYPRSGNDVVPSIVGRQALDAGQKVLVDYRVDKPDDGWPQIFRIQIINGGLRDSEGRTISNQEVAVVGRNDLRAVDAELIGGKLIEGDPDSHLLSFLVQVRPEWHVLWPANPLLGSNFGTFEDAYPMLGWDREILPALEGSEMAPPALGSFDSLRPAGYRSPSPSFNFTNDKVVMNLRINRPDGGWDTWDLGRVPYVVHAPRLKNVPSSVIASGFVALADSTKAALLFSFEDWVRRLEERAELPDGSLAGDADRDGQDSLAEFVLGSDLQDAQDTGTIKPSILKKNGRRYASLKFPIRTNSLGLTAELQHSTDGRQWHSADDEFEVVDRAPKQDGTAEIHLVAKEPLAGNADLGLFRIAVVR